jgi:hypothetical protein
MLSRCLLVLGPGPARSFDARAVGSRKEAVAALAALCVRQGREEIQGAKFRRPKYPAFGLELRQPASQAADLISAKGSHWGLEEGALP